MILKAKIQKFATKIAYCGSRLEKFHNFADNCTKRIESTISDNGRNIVHEHVHESGQQKDAEEPKDSESRRLQSQPPANNMKMKKISLSHHHLLHFHVVSAHKTKYVDARGKVKVDIRVAVEESGVEHTAHYVDDFQRGFTG